MKTLILTVGLPRSGKSTWAKDYANRHNAPIVNPDSIRLALHGQPFAAPAEPMVWAVAHLMVSSLFKAGHTEVILDATNVTEHRRKDWRSREWTCRYVCFDTPSAVCIFRAIELGQTDLIPVIERMAKSLTWPLPPNQTAEGEPSIFFHWREGVPVPTPKVDETEADRQRAEERRLLTTPPRREGWEMFMRTTPPRR